MTLVDTNVILDIVTDDPQWRRWSQFSLDVAVLAGPLIINGIVYAELSVRYESMEELDTLLAEMGFRMESVSRAGLFLAAKVHRQYRSRGGTRSGVLSDFFIGAHAAVRGYTLLTRDPARYRNYFPSLRLIVPD